MHSLQQLRWRDVLDDILFPSELTFEWIKLEFERGFQSNDRDGLYITGPYGVAEVSPLPGYFDREIECVLSAIDTVSNPWPEVKTDHVETNILVSNDYDLQPSELENQKCVKVKVHTLHDVERVKKARDMCGPKTKIRIDCNGRFSVDEARELVTLLHDVDLELIEQPCRSNSKNAKLRRKIDIPIAIDETARSLEDIAKIKDKEAADAIVVKVQPCGGIHRARHLIEEWGGDVIVAHMMESDVGLNVGMRLAQSLDSLPYSCGLITPRLQNVIREPLDI